MNAPVAGIDLGGTKTTVLLGRRDGTVLAREQFPTGETETPDAWCERVDALLTRVSGDHVPAGIGVSTPGPMSVKEGRLIAPPNMPAWRDVPLRDLLEGRRGRPVAMQNDANACVLAEHYFGARRDCKNLIYLTASTGMGGGVIAGGVLVQGASDLGGEVGHMVLDRDGPPCPCGLRGCFELYCGGKNVADGIRQRLAREGRTSAILRLAGGRPEEIRFEHLVAAWQEGDAFAGEVWNEYLERLAQGVGCLLQAFNPEVVLLGTIAVHLGERLLAPLRQRVSSYAWAGSVAACRIEASTLGASIGDKSALATARWAFGGTE